MTEMSNGFHCETVLLTHHIQAHLHTHRCPLLTVHTFSYKYPHTLTPPQLILQNTQIHSILSPASVGPASKATYNNRTSEQSQHCVLVFGVKAR